MKLLMVSDAWYPQINGVVTSLQALIDELKAMGHEVGMISPQDFRTFPCPGYDSIPLSWNVWKIGEMIRNFQPDAVHLATEGPLGWAARRWLLRNGMQFSTAIHTRFPEYVHQRCSWLPLSWGYAWLRAFHRPASAVMVSTQRLMDEFAGHDFRNLVLWRKGVDTRHFTPRLQPDSGAPVFLYAGRLAPEKNVEAFLALELPGSKVVVGEGPLAETLRQRFPDADFRGFLSSEHLARAYREASVLVFPSHTDTLGLVMLEALACGTPVAAFPVPGPLDVLRPGVSGVMMEDLRAACLAALQLNRHDCAAEAAGQSWQASAAEFMTLQPDIHGASCLQLADASA